jgi:hypothetical protein
MPTPLALTLLAGGTAPASASAQLTINLLLDVTDLLQSVVFSFMAPHVQVRWSHFLWAQTFDLFFTHHPLKLQHVDISILTVYAIR